MATNDGGYFVYICLMAWIAMLVVGTLGTVVMYVFPIVIWPCLLPLHYYTKHNPILTQTQLLIFTFSLFKYWIRDTSVYTKKQLLTFPGVTILRPLKGIDNNLEKNLESSFKQKYEVYEIIFSVADPSDPAINIVKKLQAKYPLIQSSLIIGKFHF